MANQECDCLKNEDELKSLLDGESQITSVVDNEDQIYTDFENVVEIMKTYSGSETKDIIVDVDNGKRKISATLQKMWYKSIYDFPSVGSSNLLYGETTTNTLYYWNQESVSYEKLISDWNEIEVINGGRA